MLELKEKYIIIPQKPYFCGIACFLMILYRNNKILFEQEDLGHYFGLKIHPDLQRHFNSEFETTTEINDDEGLKTIELEKDINNFLKDKKIELTAKAFKFSDIKNLKSFIGKNISDGCDMWVEYKTEGMFPGSKGIHDGLIESIDGSVITMIDPGPQNKNRYKVHLDYLGEALSDKFARETGIIVIKKK